MNYWHIQLQPDYILSEDTIKKILVKKEVIGLWSNWEDKNGNLVSDPDDFKNQMKIGDIVMVRNTITPVALVQVTSDFYEEKNLNKELDWFPIRRKINVLGNFNEVENKILKEVLKANDRNHIQAPGTLTKCQGKNATNNFIKNWYKRIMSNQQFSSALDILKYKKQIILKGPPGTGKTRLAKMLAEKLTAKEIKENPIKEIKTFFENFEPNDKVLNHRKIVDGMISRFLNKFKKENLKNLKLEQYALGKDDKDNFCYWIEYNLIHTGRYAGQASKGKIYWDVKNEEYKKNGFIKNIEDDEIAMKKVAELLDKIVSEKIEKYPIGDGFVLKVLNTYHPDKYFPISKEECLTNFLKIIKQDYNSLNFIEKNKIVQDYFLKMKEQYNSDVTNYEFMYFLFENFDLKGKVIVENDELVTEGEAKLIQFHPSYSYEDFVRGITVKTDQEGKIEYVTENKVFAKITEEAANNKSANYVLIIDEINRANLPSVLGELIYALEYRGESVESMYSVDGDNSLTIPENLFIIGTMNTADRSVGHIDYAIKRRFSFVNVLPNKEVISNDKAKELFNLVEKLFSKDLLASDFNKNDVQLGHSYFLLKKGTKEEQKQELQMRLKYEIVPILEEYKNDGLLLEKATEEINKISNFEC